MGAREIFQKQGGMKLLKQLWKNGSLFTAAGEFVLLGKSRTALEILRLATQLKVKQKLEKKYKKELEGFDRTYDAASAREGQKVIWACWFQGMEQAPDIVRRCFRSLKENIHDREIIVITEENMDQYVTFPDAIQEKIRSGAIRGAHLSDLLRLELLTRYGGTWIDSTVYCSGDQIPAYMLDSELFLFQNLKPGRDGHTTVISNWFMTANRTHNRLLEAVKYLLYSYWQTHDSVVDYYVFHDLFQIVIEYYPAEWNRVVPFCNSIPHILLLRLFEPFDQQVWDAVRAMIPFHKLTYKFDAEKTRIENTYYTKIMTDKG